MITYREFVAPGMDAGARARPLSPVVRLARFHSYRPEIAEA